MRALIIAVGLAVGFGITWWIAGMIDSTRSSGHVPAQSTTNELPRLLRPGLGFAFLVPR